MAGQNIVSSVRAARGSSRLLAHIFTLFLMYVLGLAAVFLTPPGSNFAAWWPAAGLGVAAMLFAKGPAWRMAIAIALVTTASNYVAGRPLEVAVLFGVANACEAWLVSALITRGGRAARLEGMPDVARLLGAVLAGATVFGLLAGGMVWMLLGGDFLASGVALAVSHASAVIVIVPTVLASASSLRVGRGAERLIQLAVLAAVVFLVFSPGQILSLAFLTFPVLGWATFRFGVKFVAVEILITGVCVTVLTSVGGGPFVHEGFNGFLTSTELLQVYLISQAATMLFLSTARRERENLALEVEAREQLLRGGFVGAQVGFVILAQHDTDSIRAVEGNSVAAQLLDWPELAQPTRTEMLVPIRGGSPFVEVVAKVLTDAGEQFSGDIELQSGHLIEVFVTRFGGEDGAAVATAQLIDVTARREAERATIDALRQEQDVAERLRDLSRQKDNFASSVSHELRTPITSILGFAEELEETTTGDDQAYVRIILRNARRLTDLVENLLEISSMTTQNSIRPVAAVDVNSVLRACIGQQGDAALGRNQTVTVSVDLADPEVLCDVRDLSRIVSNVLSNALKFTPEHGSVELSSSLRGDHVEVVVTDSGPGIPSEDVEHVFERFYRSPAATLKGMPGTGLGLSIVQSLVDRLGGYVTITDAEPHGTTVKIALPAVTAVSEEPAIVAG
ncbi:signal transduction histidine kinase [Marisediminicola sp. UYEF4]|uniref:sensor histidine kinase n=1 Tax=Marisediminicola sp. UYEF4 TaxID=1756384 RepID=UPI0033937A50